MTVRRGGRLSTAGSRRLVAEGGAAFIRIAVTAFCAARLNAGVTRTAPRSEASRWPTATPTPYSRPRATISTPHRTTVSTDPWRHKVPSASRHTLMVWPRHTPSPATAPRSPRAARDRRAPARSSRQAADPEEGQDQRGQHQQPRLDPRHLYLPGQHPDHGGTDHRASATVLAFMTPPGTAATGARRGRHDSSSVRDCRVTAGRVLASVPFRRGCRQMPRSGRLADRADPADLK